MAPRPRGPRCSRLEIGALADPNTAGKGSLRVYGSGQDFGVLGEAGTSGTGTGVGVQAIGFEDPVTGRDRWLAGLFRLGWLRWRVQPRGRRVLYLLR